jgi:hypothetical protein
VGVAPRSPSQNKVYSSDPASSDLLAERVPSTDHRRGRPDGG